LEAASKLLCIGIEEREDEDEPNFDSGDCMPFIDADKDLFSG
jgi:hypothetical protein